MSGPALEVFWISARPYAWRVLLTLEVKGVGYTHASCRPAMAIPRPRRISA
jgi:hypothetical protein